jgi:murein DD-endopeptidase MepM/ murein hydrolase activator NlpD
VVSAIADRVTEYPTIVSGAAQSSVAGTAAAYLHPSVVLSTTPSVLVRHQAEARATDAPSAVSAAAGGAPAAAETPGVGEKFTTYTIQPGDTVYTVADSFGIDANYIMWNNPEVREDPDYLLIGAEVLIPSVNGLVYTVTLGDTLSDIAAYYNTDIQSITSFGPNALSSPDDVIEGMVLVLPGAVPPAPPPPPEPEPAPVEIVEPEPVYDEPAPGYAAAPPPAPAPARVSAGFIWPFYGPISTYFSGYHRGIDIDGFGSYGATIVAAADGVVVLAASQSWGYGNHVIIEHGDGSRTLYAHLSEMWVGQGEYVGQGQGIGALGSTGYSTGPHLHFEVHIGGPVDPLGYLP